VFDILRSVSPNRKSTLSVWGAGRTTDLELISLLRHYGKIELVELNASLTRRAMVQRGFDEHSNVTVAPATDLAGLEGHWESFMEKPDEAKLDAIIESTRSTSLDLGRYDVVVSTCLLSQVLRKVSDCLAASGLPEATVSDYLPRIVRAIREKHLDLMLEHTLPGGAAVLVTDLTSSEALPEMLKEGADLQQLFATKVIQGNHFHGMNPQLILESARQEPVSAKLKSVQVTSPWVWNAIEMQYLCVAFQFRRKSA
jgi:hypothetical protein